MPCSLMQGSRSCMPGMLFSKTWTACKHPCPFKCRLKGASCLQLFQPVPSGWCLPSQPHHKLCMLIGSLHLGNVSSMKQSCHSETGSVQCRPRSPDVGLSNGQIRIKFAVHDGTDFKWLLSRLLVILGDQGSTAAVQEGKAELQVLLSPNFGQPTHQMSCSYSRWCQRRPSNDLIHSRHSCKAGMVKSK